MYKPKTPRTIMSEEDDKTRIVRPLDQLQRPITPQPSDIDPTRKIDREEVPDTRTIKPIRTADEGKTVLFRPSPNRPTGATTTSPSTPRAEPGNAVRLGYGWNSIGRDPSQRASLNFGPSDLPPQPRKTPLRASFQEVLTDTRRRHQSHLRPGRCTACTHRTQER